jgi:hypothetical protein
MSVVDEATHSVTDPSSSTSLLGDEFVSNHLSSVLLGLFRSISDRNIERVSDHFDLVGRKEERVRVDHLDTTFQTVLSVEVTLSSTSGENLSLDDELVGTCRFYSSVSLRCESKDSELTKVLSDVASFGSRESRF